MNKTSERALLYGSAILVVAGIGVLWSRRVTDADVVTLLSSAQVQIQMAYAIPATDKLGQRLSARQDLIDGAEQNLTAVERIEPGLAGVAEGMALVHMLRGDFVASAASYHEAQGRADCKPDQRDVLAFNEARMLAKAGKPEAALQCFANNAAVIDARYAHHRALEEAGLLQGLGRTTEAAGRVENVLQDAAAPAAVVLQAGLAYVALGLDDKAATALMRASQEAPIAYYHLAQLKLQRGEVDTSMQLLERAKRAQPAEVGRLLRDEAAAWSAVAKDARFQQLGESAPATPGR